MRTPRKQGSASWICETIDSRVFTAAPPSVHRARIVAHNSDAAGMGRERVASRSLAETTFFNAPRPHAHYPNHSDLMSGILYGHDGASSNRRTKGPAKAAFEDAAGNPTAKQHAVADRHPNLQKHAPLAHKSGSQSARAAASSVGPVVFGASDGVVHDATSQEEQRRVGRAPGLGGASSGDSAVDLIYAGTPLPAPAPQATPARKIKGPGVFHSASAAELRATPLFVDYTSAAAGRSRGGGSDVTSFAGDEPYTTKGYGRRTYHNVSNVGDVAFALGAGSESGPLGGPELHQAAYDRDYQPLLHRGAWYSPPQSARMNKRGTGAYHPLSGHLGGAAVEIDTNLVHQYADALRSRNESRTDAGVASVRLNTLVTTGGGISASGPNLYKDETAYARRAQGMSEGRAGAGPRVDNEVRLCGPSRRAASTVPKRDSMRNPIFGEASSISPDRSAAGKVRHPSHSANDHLESTLVPADMAPRRQGKGAVGGAAARTTFAIAQDPVTESPSCGKRHIDHPTHEPAPFELHHKLHDRSAPPAVPPPPTPSATMREGHPPLLHKERSRATSDASEMYATTRHRGTTSQIFNDLQYAPGPPVGQ